MHVLYGLIQVFRKSQSRFPFIMTDLLLFIQSIVVMMAPRYIIDLNQVNHTPRGFQMGMYHMLTSGIIHIL